MGKGENSAYGIAIELGIYSIENEHDVVIS